MFQPIQLSYLTRNSKQRKDGTVPIYLRIRVNGDIAELSASRRIDPGSWNSEKGRIKGSKPDAHSMNNTLDLLKAKVNEAYRKLLQERKGYWLPKTSERNGPLRCPDASGGIDRSASGDWFWRSTAAGFNP